MKPRRPRPLACVACAVATVLLIAGAVYATGWCLAQVSDAVRDAGP